MRTVRPIAWTIACLGMAIGVIFLALFGFSAASLPRLSGEMALPGLQAPVTVTRDARGIPYIRAGSEHDAMIALGFVHAQDRFLQMDLQRRLGAGRLSEQIGPATLGVDRVMRSLGLYELARAGYEDLSEDARAALDAYADGVNAYLSGRDGWQLNPAFLALSSEPAPWQPADSLVWGKLMALRLSGNWRRELTRFQLDRSLGPDLTDFLLPGGDGQRESAATENNALAPLLPLPGRGVIGPMLASNLWAVSGQHTMSGSPLLANDPHLGFSAPVQWYLVRIELPDALLVGATAPGVPFLLLGHNGQIAWGFTTTGSDTSDLYIEQIDPEDPRRYLTENGPRAFDVSTEAIPVAGEAPAPLTIRHSRHGLVLSDLGPDIGLPEEPDSEPALVLALASMALQPGDQTAEALYRLAKARSWDDFLAALRMFHVPQQNIVYADRQGHIGLIAPGKLPRRRVGLGTRPVSGQEHQGNWDGIVAFDELPRWFAPENGRLVNANNALIPPDAQPYLGDGADIPDRADRIDTMLSIRKKHDVESFAAMQMDSTSSAARRWLERALPLLSEAEHQDPLARALAGWDGVMDRQRPEPLVYRAWRQRLDSLLLGPLVQGHGTDSPPDDLEADRHDTAVRILTGNQMLCDDPATADREDCQARVSDAWREAREALSAAYGSDWRAWRWGDAHRARFRHPVFDRIPGLTALTGLEIASDGDYHTVNRGAGGQPDAARFPHSHGAGYRAVYDLADLDRSGFSLAAGQSGHPLSRHYGDRMRDWRDGAILTLPARPARPSRTLRLLPAKKS